MKNIRLHFGLYSKKNIMDRVANLKFWKISILLNFVENNCAKYAAIVVY